MVDDLDVQYKVKMGRFSESDEVLIKRIMGKKFLHYGKNAKFTRKTSRNNSTQKKLTDFQVQECVSRSNVIAQGYSYSTGREAVVKVGKCHKSIKGVVGQISYIARIDPYGQNTNELESVEFRDGYGIRVPHEEALNVHRNWDLLTDEENLSMKNMTLKRNSKNEKGENCKGDSLLCNIQSWHFILSIEESGSDQAVEEKFTAAVAGTLDSVFVARGHKLLWGVHSEHTDHIHAHLVVKAESELGGRIRSDFHGDFLNGVRVEFARNLRLAGLDYQATRRVDRINTRKRIMAGHEPLQNNYRLWKKDRRKSKDFDSLMVRHPWLSKRRSEWDVRLNNIRRSVYDAVDGISETSFAKVVVDIIRENFDRPPLSKGLLWRITNKRRIQQEDDKAAKKYKNVLDEIKQAFHRPSEALAAWQNVAMGGSFRDKKGKAKYPDRSFANWILINRPELFGAITSSAFDLPNNKLLRVFLRKAWLPSPETVAMENQALVDITKDSDQALVIKNRKAVIGELNRQANRAEFELGNKIRAKEIRKFIPISASINIGQQLLDTQVLNLENVRPTIQRDNVSPAGQVGFQIGTAAHKQFPDNENMNIEGRKKTIIIPKKRSGWGR